MGSSIVYWAELEASRQESGRSLGFNRIKIYWIGVKGLTFNDFDTLVDTKLRCLPHPNFMIIHCGANDLTGTLTGLQLVENIKCSMLRYHALIPHTTIIWSAMLQRRYWHFAPLGDGQKIDKRRKQVNRMIKNFVLDLGGKAILHDQNIAAKDSQLYRIDGTHLSKLGNKIFLNNLKGGIEALVQQGNKLFPTPQN